MSANRTLALTLGLATATLVVLVGLLTEYGPCLALGSVCLVHAVEATCRLFSLAGLPGGIGLLSYGVLAVLLAGSLLSLSTMLHRLLRTRALGATVSRTREPVPSAVARAVATFLGRGRGLDLVPSDELFAFTYGLVKPRVCLSTAVVNQLAPDELAALLLHEETHAQRRDPLRTLLTQSLARGLFFLPILRDLDEHLRLRQEVEADLQAAGAVGVRALAGALHRLLSGTPPAGLRGAAASGISANRRIDHLLGRDNSARLEIRTNRLWLSVGLALVALCLLAF